MKLIDADKLIKELEIHNETLREGLKDARTEIQKLVYNAQLLTAKEIIEVIKTLSVAGEDI